MTLRADVISGLKWTGGARLLGQLATWGITIVVMRLLTPADYGLLSLATIFVAFLGLVSEIGLSAGIVQSQNIGTAQLRAVFGAILTVNVLLCLVVAFVVAPAVAFYFGEPRLHRVMQALASQFLISAFAVVPGALLERDLKFRARSVLDLLSTIAASVLTLTLAYNGYGVWALVWGTLAQIFLRSLGFNIIRPFPHWPSFAFPRGGHLFRFSRDVVFTRLLWYFYSQADAFIAGKTLGTNALGLYSVSMHLASIPVQRTSSIINQVAFAAFARANRDAGGVDTHTLLSVRALSFFAFPVLWGMSCVSPELIGLLLGKTWEPAVPAFMLLCLIMPIRMLSPVLHAALQGVGRADVSLRNTLFAAIVMPVAFYVGARFDLLGLALAWVVVFPLVFMLNLARSLRFLKLQLRQVAMTIMPPAAISAAMYATVTVARFALDNGPATRLPILVFLGVIVYGILSLTFNRDGIREIWAMVVRQG